MSLTAKQAFILARKYTDESISGISGALAGKNCTVKSVEDIEGGIKVTLAWYDDGQSTERTTFFTIMDGEEGPQGPAPEITVKEDTATSYILHIKSGSLEFDTPNLIGSGGTGTDDYTKLRNKPSIGGQTLDGNLELEDIGDVPIDDDTIVNAVNLAFGNT